MKYLFFIVFVYLCNDKIYAQQYADAIKGKWKSEDKKTVVEIYRQGDKYFGKIVWQAQPNDATTGKPRTDLENPDALKRNRPLMGLQVLYDLEFDDGYWQDGEIYNSQNGETYDVNIWLEGNDILKLKVYWYFTHQTQTWTREK
ncbi:MAG: DUF2147 domain-containing protein [Fimbriimonadaceae bacterium]|nr:DUF2147 domain-containing protein [Chitinophagales bacterium]